mmetsp:Transcript_14107/g.34974  ORF Transcript_14107/g.34974 Transcript_14107/m.34974 type:complete len:412 (-) Transcript_14107:417-1652(-)|eukprot:CAMPEP_0178996854 /NCGR_PEP_ID=MMETSP0795-20121207/8604_1 /TAXON_ID=88552 /ORGANISM="Amoebophrya sp., Strain Ameob2" /LENGTH=411 /DNA_ID=CAMNT_0020689299 /DNA_START=437 /DNA_END=1672 /DNA_ORIENTATION=+
MDRQPQRRISSSRRAGAASAKSRIARLLVAVGCRNAAGDLNNLYPPTYVSNPIARHVAFNVEVNKPGIAQLSGFETDNHPLEYYITTLPEVGKLYETSQNFRSYGSEPKNAPTPIQGHQLPFLVTDQLYRVAYIPPANVFAPVGRWASFSYTVKDTTTNIVSEPGRCVLANAGGIIVGSSFVSGSDGWTIEGNLLQSTPVHQPYAWGKLNRYIYGTDEVQYVDFVTGVDRQSWYFVAPQSYSSQDMAAAYGGTMRFTVKATYGDFDYLNEPPALNWVVLECASCNDGKGLRIVRQVDAFFKWHGEETTIELEIRSGNSWVRDPLNGALPFTSATECEIAATLNGLTKLKILGDFTKAGEGVAIDDVSVTRAPVQPAFPIQCQQGCTCRHYPAMKRLSCCGNLVQTTQHTEL